MSDRAKNPHAVALGRLAKGKPKRYSKTEIARRIERLRLARNARKLTISSGKIRSPQKNA